MELPYRWLKIKGCIYQAGNGLVQTESCADEYGIASMSPKGTEIHFLRRNGADRSRLMATEIGRPMLINDEDCDAGYPESLKEEEAMPDIFHPQRPTILQATIYVARLLQPLAHLCRSLCIPIDAIRNFEMHLGACMQLFPPELRLGGTTPLDPSVMAPLIFFQNTRIILHRHNLSPASSPEQRSIAIKNCCMAAEDTAATLSRCFDAQVPVEQMESRLRLAATSLICTHVWRCLLFLSFCQAWRPFHVLLRFLSIVADGRLINISCGRYLGLFLDRLVQKYQQDAPANLEDDVELIVLLSGDLQAGPNSWIWNSKDTSALPSQKQRTASHTSTNIPVSEHPPKPDRTLPWDIPLSDDERTRWGGWDRAYQAAQYLEQLQRSRPTQAGLPENPIVSPDVETRPAPSRAEADRSTGTGKSRMTIASITDQ